jgi:hypothetical protein
MADVLMVSALELGHPMLLFILVIADDAFLHSGAGLPQPLWSPPTIVFSVSKHAQTAYDGDSDERCGTVYADCS